MASLEGWRWKRVLFPIFHDNCSQTHDFFIMTILKFQISMSDLCNIMLLAAVVLKASDGGGGLTDDEPGVQIKIRKQDKNLKCNFSIQTKSSTGKYSWRLFNHCRAKTVFCALDFNTSLTVYDCFPSKCGLVDDDICALIDHYSKSGCTFMLMNVKRLLQKRKL